MATNAKRVIFDVSPGRDGGWEVKQQGGSSVATAQRKDEAIVAARERAKREELSQVRIRGRNGQLQREYTYGKDPRSRKG